MKVCNPHEGDKERRETQFGVCVCVSVSLTAMGLRRFKYKYVINFRNKELSEF